MSYNVQYIDANEATHIRIFYGYEGYEIDAANDQGCTENVWTHFNDELLSLEKAKEVIPLFCEEIQRPDLQDKVVIKENS